MKTINVSDETYELIKGQLHEEEKVNLSCVADMVGKKFFFRTVTYHFVGLVKKTFGNFLVLENASWVADSGRFMQAIKNGTLDEVEPLGDWNVNLNTVTDFGVWKHDLPMEQK